MGEQQSSKSVMKQKFINTLQALAFYVSTNQMNQNDLAEDYRTINMWIVNGTNQFYKRLESNGPVGTLSRYKSIYNGLKAKVLGMDNYQSLLDPFITTTKQGCPKELSMVSHLIFGGSPGIRVIMTALRLFESIKLETKFDKSSITTAYTGKPIQPIIKDFKSFLVKGFDKFGSKVRRYLILSNLQCHELSFRFKSGPMGPSILTSHLCALAIRLNAEYYQFLFEYCQLTKSYELLRYFEQSVDLCIVNVGNSHKLITGKISLAAEPAGKTRLFAICNFGVQSALKPFHDMLMKSLTLFESDGTFDQVGQFNRILKETKGKITYCFDLSKATDRFPILLQQVLLEVIFNAEFALSGTKLISFLPFHYNNKSYGWSVGQPLGAFSSGAMFALTHHLVVQYCYYKVTKRLRGFSQYSLLGDDIVIGHCKTAQQYQQFMKSVGVDINLQKSFVGLTNSGEFAKRHFKDGFNISGFGYQMIKQANASLTGWIRFLEILESEGFIAQGAVILLPGINGKELSKTLKTQLTGLGTLRNAFAQHLLLFVGNEVVSDLDLLEHYVLERINLLNNQINSSLKQKDFLKLTRKIVKLSQRGGVAVKPDCLDISFVNGELVSHPFVRYLNLRNNIIFDKIEQFYTVIKDSLFSSSNILTLSSYTQEEFIPSMTVDTFFTQDLNEVKHKIKTSIQSKALKGLIKSNLNNR